MGTVFTMYNATWLVDLWEPDGQKIREQLAYAKCFACAEAAFEVALEVHPFDRITFRQGARLMRERQASTWTSKAAGAAKRGQGRGARVEELPELITIAREVAARCKERSLFFHRGIYADGVSIDHARTIDEQELAPAAHLLGELCDALEVQAEQLLALKAAARAMQPARTGPEPEQTVD